MCAALQKKYGDSPAVRCGALKQLDFSLAFRCRLLPFFGCFHRHRVSTAVFTTARIVPPVVFCTGWWHPDFVFRGERGQAPVIKAFEVFDVHVSLWPPLS